MTFQEFQESISEPSPSQNISQNLVALWHDAKGNWAKAHDIVQETSGVEGDWIHAYLHRKEGDPGNASYWYNRIGKAKPKITLQQEWEELVRYLLIKMS